MSGEWISVEKSLPENQQLCIVWAYDTWAGTWFYHIDKWRGDGWFVCIPECNRKVTYWMPAPEPPEEEEKND